MSGRFASAGQEPGMEIWRVEDLEPAAVDKDFYGQFYTGDSYIVLFTKQNARGKLEWNIHFWLGTETTVDEKGAAAHITVELDDALGGSPKQYREVQGHESDLFLSYFRAQGGVEYLPGGTASGFRHVTPTEYPTRLLQIKGRRNVRMNQVDLGVASLNKGDVFILDMGNKIFTWFGPDSNRKEQAKGLQVASKLRGSRGTPPETILLKGDESCEEFWSTLGGSFGDVADAGAGGSDSAAERKAEADVSLHRVEATDDGSSTTAVERVDGHYTRDQLDSEGIFLLDTPGHVYVWVGKGSDKALRKAAMKLGTDFLSSAGKPEWSQVSREIDGGETPTFKEFFHIFNPPRPLDTDSGEGAGAGETESKSRDPDFSALYAAGEAPSERMLDDGSGTLTIWRVVDVELAELSKELYGQFFAGDSYVILYTFTNTRGRPDAVVYFWQGRKSSIDEKGASALHATRVAGENNNAAQVRVTQGKEPAHFCTLFKGRMVVHSGGVAGKFDSAEAGAAAEAVAAEGGTKLYHVKGTSASAAKGVQVEAKAASLNSGDCYVLVADSGCFCWQGSKSSDDEHTTATTIANILNGEREVSAIVEGEESDDFWELLGGKADYPHESVPGVGAAEPRLFQLSNALGSLVAEEVYNFCQDDLDSSDVFILDSWTQMFVWIGNDANAEEKEGAMAAAQQFIDGVKDGRDPDTPIIRVEHGHEPEMFTVNFVGWDPAAAAVFEDPYQRRLRQLREQAEKDGGTVPVYGRDRLKKVTRADADETKAAPEPEPEPAAAAEPEASKVEEAKPTKVEGTYPYEQLRRDYKGEKLTGLVETKREEYLSKEEFEKYFEMTREEFNAMKKWRRDKLKKEHRLF